jgi:CRISPR-associated endonuclease/helicase Cas3
MTYAHSPNGLGAWHDLRAHLRGTAERARAFAEPFGGGDAAATLGFWHDLGKFNPAWQTYLDVSTENPRLRRTGPARSLHPSMQPSARSLS